MSDEVTVYDLGNLEPSAGQAGAPTRSRVRTQTQASAVARPHPVMATNLPAELVRPTFDFHWTGSLSLLVPGAGQLARGDVALGLFFLTTSAFLGTTAWAVFSTLDRLSPTMELLGLPRTAGLWALVALYVGAAMLYVGNTLSAVTAKASSRRRAVLHPALSGLASLLVPGWGQALNGDRWRAVLFLSGLWVAGAAWLLVSAPAPGILDAHGLHVPAAMSWLTSPVVRWTAPAVVWSLAVYDAVLRARSASS